MINKERLLLISRLQRTMVQSEVSTLRMTLLSERTMVQSEVSTLRMTLLSARLGLAGLTNLLEVMQS